MSYLIGMDIGTSSVKAVLTDEKRNVLKTAHGVFEYEKTTDGRVEISADKYINVCVAVLKELALEVKGDVSAICASSASGNLLILDKNMNPLTPVINWQDKRVNDEAHEILGETDTDKFYRQIGWPFGYKILPLAQLCYIKKHSEDILNNAGMVCMSTEYLYYKLTKKWGITTSAGTPFFFIDQQKGEYIPELLEKFNLCESQFPPVKKTGEILGGVTADMTELTGLKEGTPVVLGTFDHPSAARGAGILNEGELLLSCGTSWVAFFPVKDREKIANAGMLIDPFLSETGGCWAGMSSVASISERIWLYVKRYISDGKDAFKELSRLARQSEKGTGGLVINPKNEPCDEMILKYPVHHIARAIMEGTVMLLKEKLELLKDKGITAAEGVMVGGPSEDPLWIEIISEMCDLKLCTVNGKNAGAVGAAVIAGNAAGAFEK